MLNPPTSFAGRKVGALVTDGADAALVKALKAALKEEGATLEIIAPTIGGAKASDGKLLSADHKIGGAPSVLFDAVALIVSEEGAASLARNAAATEFVADAFGHLKFIAFSPAATPLLRKAGIDQTDEGFVELGNPASAAGFVKTCRKLRLWAREEVVNFSPPSRASDGK
jgi:catalase